MGDLTREQIQELVATAPRQSDVGCGCETCAHARTANALRQLLSATEWKPIDEEAKNGKPHLFICRWKDQVGYAEEQIVLRWEIDGWFDWDSVKLNESIPVAYMPLPPSPAEGE